MDILLIVATLAVAAAGLYVAATFNRRTRQHTAPLIEGAVKDISEHVDETTAELRGQLKTIAGELQRDRDQIRLDGRKVQGRLDHADSRTTSIANQLLAELETVRRLAEQLGARQDQFGADLRQLEHRVTDLGGPPARSEATHDRTVADAPPTVPVPRPAAPPAVVPGRLYAERLRFALVRTQPEPGALVRILIERCLAELPGSTPGDPGDARAVISRAENEEGFRAELSQAAAGYFATVRADPATSAATERWITQEAFPGTAAAEVASRIGDGLGSLVERPLAQAGAPPGLEAITAAGPPGLQTGFLEIIGAVVETGTGLHPLALAAAIMLARDRFHDSVAHGLREAAHRVFGGPAREPPPSWWEP